MEEFDIFIEMCFQVTHYFDLDVSYYNKMSLKFTLYMIYIS